MAYIGRGTDNISNVEVLDNITFNGNSSYTLQKGGANFVPVSANNILLSIDGVVQANNFSVSGSTIDFGTAVTGTCNFVLHFGTGLITTVQDGAVTTAKIGDDAVTYAKLQNLATANRVLGSTSTGLIGETQIATAMVSDDAITYAKMQDTSAANRVLGAVSAGTVGEVQVATDMIADAQVDESKLKISNAPTNGYFLSAQSGNTGGLTWAEAGGGDLVLLSSTTPTGANTLSIDGFFTSDYDVYKIYALGMSGNGSMSNTRISYKMNVSGSAVTGYAYSTVNNSGSTLAIWADNTSASYMDAGYVHNSSGSTAQGNLELIIHRPLSTDKTTIIHQMTAWDNGTTFGRYFGASADKTARAISGITLGVGAFGSGGIEADRILVYGMKNS